MIILKFNQLFTKWLFTVSIAALPLIFEILKSIIQYGDVDLWEIGLSGELFIVSIVMVAEPLWELMTSKNRDVISILLMVIIFIFILVTAFMYSVTPRLYASYGHDAHLDKTILHSLFSSQFNSSVLRAARLSFLQMAVGVFFAILSFIYVAKNSRMLE